MKVLYVGQYSLGTTSKMRADQIKDILNPQDFSVIDTHVPFFKIKRIWRSIGARFFKGPLIKEVNNYVIEQLQKKEEVYDLVWVDKAVFLENKTTEKLRSYGKKLIHYTPDMAFFHNRSSKFEKSLPLYDFVVTTKSMEVNFYKKFTAPEKIINTSQGFSKKEHHQAIPFQMKQNCVAFIGLAEKSRFLIIETLLNNGIKVKIAGMGWERFAKKNERNSNLSYYGKGLYGEDYTKFISSSFFALGLLSKRFPELHTTRTFEIPACGTALITERNEETESFFKEDEAVFYSSPEEMIVRIKSLMKNEKKIIELTKRGQNRVFKDGYDYESILKKILNEIIK